MSKEFIRDDGVVRLCTSNIAKMNVFECMYYTRHRMKDKIVDVAKEFADVWRILLNVLAIMLLPIAYPIMAWRYIKSERKIMEHKSR